MLQGYAYDDVLVVPQRSLVDSRSNVSLETTLGDDVTLTNPFISAPMDTVTEGAMAQAMADSGAMGFIHRFISFEEQVEMVSNIDGPVGGTIGLAEDSNEAVRKARELDEAGADIVCLDIAHGHMESCVELTEVLSSELPGVTLCVGNVATSDGAYELVEAGADIVKVGIGSGSHCLTREVAGVGVPQFTAINQAVEGRQRAIDAGIIESAEDMDIIADGGIQKSGDIVKALLTGADAIMAGGLFAGCLESPAEEVTLPNGETVKKSRGMASEEARVDRGDTVGDQSAIEGAECVSELVGTAEDKVSSLSKGVRSGVSYCGSHSLSEARDNCEFIEVTNSTINRNGTHGTALDVDGDL